MIQRGEITSNRIFISPELVLAFKENWQKLVDTPHTENFALPFFHLKNEPFWNLVTYNGLESLLTSSKSIKSFRALKENVAFAEIDKELFLLLSDKIQSEILTKVLLEKYFPNTYLNYNLESFNKEKHDIENQMLYEPKEEYQHHIKELQSRLNEDEFEEEIFMRWAF